VRGGGGGSGAALWTSGGITARGDAVRRPFTLVSFSILIPNALSSFFSSRSQSCREQVALPLLLPLPLLLLIPSLGAAAAAAATVGPLGDSPRQDWPLWRRGRTSTSSRTASGITRGGRASASSTSSSASSSMSSSTSSSASSSIFSLLLLLFLVFFYFSATSTSSATTTFNVNVLLNLLLSSLVLFVRIRGSRR